SGIGYAVSNGANVISMSLGGSSGSSTVETAINDAWGAGVVVVAAAGNSGSSSPSYPAYYPHVIAVAATTSTDAKASYSNYGSWVDVAAPGSSILSTATNHSSRIWTKSNTYGTISGTSMATPHVAGLAGLIWSSGPCGTGSPVDKATCVRGRIETKAERITGTGSYWTYGRINAAASLSSTSGGTNTAPVANDQSVTVSKNKLKKITLSASDVDGDPLTYAIVSGPASGTLSAVSGAQVTYTPNPNYTGLDTFTFKANDGKADSNTATVSITVSSPGAKAQSR
ncbi:MAG TPA: S8 family serine peptidase, partial [Chloroflexota bacterium]